MDAETIITLVIIAVGVLWNLIVKMRERMTLPESSPPWAEREEQAETYMEDLSPYTVVEEKETRTSPLASEYPSQESSFFLSREKPKETVPDTKSIYDSKCRKKQSQCGRMSRSKLKEAVIWSEILAPPVAVRFDRS